MTDVQNSASEQLMQEAKACLASVANSLVEDFREKPLSDVGRQYILELISPPAESKLTADQNSEYWFKVPNDKQLIISGLRRVIDNRGWTEAKDSIEANQSRKFSWPDWVNALQQNPLTSDFAAKYQQEIDTAALESAKRFASKNLPKYLDSLVPAHDDVDDLIQGEGQTEAYYQSNPQLRAARDGMDVFLASQNEIDPSGIYKLVGLFHPEKIESVIDNAKTTAELESGMVDVLCEYLNSLLGEKTPESLKDYLNSRTPQATLNQVGKPAGLMDGNHVSDDALYQS